MKLFKKRELYTVLCDVDAHTTVMEFAKAVCSKEIRSDYLDGYYIVKFIPGCERATVNLGLMATFKEDYRIQFHESFTMLAKES